jgi:acetyl esterase
VLPLGQGDIVTRAYELLPIPPRGEPEVYEGMEMTTEQQAAISVEERFVPGDPPVRVLVYRPKDATGALPLILEIHGGAFCVLRADSFPLLCASYAQLGAVVVSVDYRLAPEYPFPIATEECYAALCWAIDELEVDRSRVVVTGGSAGGALSAAVALMARDRGGPAISLQALNIPVLDDRLQTTSMRQFVGEHPGFNGDRAEGMWLHYLGEDADRSATSAYAAPARAESLAGLPPAVIAVHGLDPLRDEGIEYAMRLMAEGVPVELYCVPGAYHGAPPEDVRVTVNASRLMLEAIAAAIQ